MLDSLMSWGGIAQSLFNDWISAGRVVLLSI
jgi:hypothetical protein